MSKLRDFEKLKKILELPNCKEFLQKIENDDELIYFFRENYISVYYKGLVFATISAEGIRLMSDCYQKKLEKSNSKLFDIIKSSKPQQRFKLYIDNIDAIKTSMYDCKTSKERESQQKIAKKYRNNEFTIIDFEFTIPTKYSNKEELKKPEIDLIAIETAGDKPILYLIEYKRTKEALSGDAGLEAHFADFEKMHRNEQLKNDTAVAAVETYNKFTELLNLKRGIIYLENIEIRFAFLFTHLDEKDYNTYLKRIYTPEFKIYLWEGKKLEEENVDMSEPAKLLEI